MYNHTILLPISEQKHSIVWYKIKSGDYMSNKYVANYVKIAQNIKRYRKRLGLSQEALAEKTCINRSYLSKIEAPNCGKSFSVETLFIIARCFTSPCLQITSI